MDRGQWANLARMLGLHPYSFSKDILGFLMITESQNLGLTSHPKDEYRNFDVHVKLAFVSHTLAIG